MFVEGAREWALTISIEKTKGMAMGEGLGDKDIAPVRVEGGGQIVDHFAYLGSVMSRDGNVTEDVKCRIAFKNLSCLRGPIFNSPILSIPTVGGRAMYKAMVLVALLHRLQYPYIYVFIHCTS